MVRTRGQTPQRKTLVNREAAEAVSKGKYGKVVDDSSSDGDSSSDEELENLVSQTLREFSSTASDDESSSESDSDDNDSEEDISDSEQPLECFIIDKKPGKDAKSVRTKGPVSAPNTQDGMGDDRGILSKEGDGRKKKSNLPADLSKR